MQATADKLRDRAQAKNLKRQEKKDAIAQSAIEALRSLGYANTTLRDIAAQSDLSLGMLHYYFEDKTQLVIHCVRIYKQRFIAEIVAAIDAADGADAVVDAFAGGLARAAVEDWDRHRLWYDIRAQAMFDETLRAIVDEIEAELTAVLGRAAARLGGARDMTLCYAALDGVFRYHAHRQAVGDGRARAEIAAAFARTIRALSG